MTAYVDATFDGRQYGRRTVSFGPCSGSCLGWQVLEVCCKQAVCAGFCLCWLYFWHLESLMCDWESVMVVLRIGAVGRLWILPSIREPTFG